MECFKIQRNSVEAYCDGDSSGDEKEGLWQAQPLLSLADIPWLAEDQEEPEPYIKTRYLYETYSDKLIINQWHIHLILFFVCVPNM